MALPMATACPSLLRALHVARIARTAPPASMTRPNAVPTLRRHASIASAGSAPAGLDMDPMTGEQLRVDDIDPKQLIIEESTAGTTPPPADQLVFGRTFTPHMLTVSWNAERGWGKPRIGPYAPLMLDPASTVLHYAACLFEGMKAYKGTDGHIRLFRPDMNMARMKRSAERLAFPTFTPHNVSELIRKLVEIDSAWIPSEAGHSLYIRPTMIGTQAGLGVAPSTDVMLFVICSPVGPYYKSGFKPIKLLASTEHVRAWPRGTGSHKLGANYATGVVPQQQAAAHGYSQILWLLGEEDELTEVGTMNLFVVFKDADGGLELVTPPIGDNAVILPGVTRDSILSLARGHADGSQPLPELSHLGKLRVSERRITMKDVEEAASAGSLVEIFGAGTAVIVSSVEGIGYRGRDIPVPVGQDGLGEVAKAMWKNIIGRQTGEIKSDWSVLVK